MDYKDAEALKASLDALMQCLNAPMLLASNTGDEQLKRLIGSLAADVAAKLDFEIMPYIYTSFPQLEAN
ncbi:MAG: hypothetical protein ACLPID_00920 [Beijerinckiaceae bacterium]